MLPAAVSIAQGNTALLESESGETSWCERAAAERSQTGGKPPAPGSSPSAAAHAKKDRRNERARERERERSGVSIPAAAGI